MLTAAQLLELINHSFRQENLTREPRTLYDPIAYMLMLGGKRMRPVMLLLSCDLFRGSVADALPAAMGIEMFHNFSLVHDDIMDRAALRRGHPTVHEKWNPETAILAGDTMLTMAFEYFLRLEEPLIRPCLEVFGKTSREVCDGQQLDMDFEGAGNVSVSQYLEMIRLKTAVLLGASLKIGAIIARTSPANQEIIYSAGIHYGLAFQLRDDLLDVYGDVSSFGKNSYGDIRNNKKTFLFLKSLELANQADRKTLVTLFSGKSSHAEEKIRITVEIYNRTHVRNQAEELIGYHVAEAEKLIGSLEVDEDRTKPLVGYMADLAGRDH